MSKSIQQEKVQTPWEIYSILVQSGVVGVWRGLLGLPFQHPFDAIKTNMQTYQKGVITTASNIYRSKGIPGFFSGFTVNSMRVISKQIYRWPSTILFFGFFQNYTEDRALLGIASGMSMSMFETAIICPFQRLKVWMMTASNKDSSTGRFLRQLSYKALFDGMFPVFLKQTVSWVSFLGATEFFKDLAYRHSKKDRSIDTLNTQQVIAISCIVALINTLVVMPVDCIKSNFQKNMNLSFDTKVPYESKNSKKKFRKITREIYQSYGIRGFYIGFWVKIVQYTINSLFTVVVFEKLLKDYENTVRKKAKQIDSM